MYWYTRKQMENAASLVWVECTLVLCSPDEGEPDGSVDSCEDVEAVVVPEAKHDTAATTEKQSSDDEK